MSWLDLSCGVASGALWRFCCLKGRGLLIGGASGVKEYFGGSWVGFGDREISSLTATVFRERRDSRDRAHFFDYLCDLCNDLATKCVFHDDEEFNDIGSGTRRMGIDDGVG